jgi:transaldolase
MNKNPLLQLKELGQSIWLDFLSRELIVSGQLQHLIEKDGLSGITSNPKIFKQAIADGDTYDHAINALIHQGCDTSQVYQSLVVNDIQDAADLLRPVYEETEGRDGFVSLEVSPHLAYDTGRTISEARALWHAVDRPNIFIKVPGTEAGVPAIAQLIGEGVNVNVTLLFGLPRYRQVARAYLAGLEARAKAGFAVDTVASVASFFLSRIDVLVDPKLETIVERGGPQSRLAASLKGQVAITSAKVAYQIYKEIIRGERFQKLQAAGARPQRLLWASTSTKSPDYSDVKYVEALIGPETINTLPLKTLAVYRDHGQPDLRLETKIESARSVLAHLAELDIRLDEVTQQLEEEGVRKFIEPFDELMVALEKKCEQYRVAQVEGVSS